MRQMPMPADVGLASGWRPARGRRHGWQGIHAYLYIPDVGAWGSSGHGLHGEYRHIHAQRGKLAETARRGAPIVAGIIPITIRASIIITGSVAAWEKHFQIMGRMHEPMNPWRDQATGDK